MDLSKNSRGTACCASLNCCSRGKGMRKMRTGHLGVILGASCGVGGVLGIKTSLFTGEEGDGTGLASGSNFAGLMCCSHETGPCRAPCSRGNGCICSVSVRKGKSSSLVFGIFRREGGASCRRAAGTLSTVFSMRLHFGSEFGTASRIKVRLSTMSGRSVTSRSACTVHGSGRFAAVTSLNGGSFLPSNKGRARTTGAGSRVG